MLGQLVFDSRSLNPVNLVRSAAFVAKEYVHRRPDRRYRCSFIEGERKREAESKVEVLRQEGIVILPAYFYGEALKRLQSAFESAVQDRPSRHDADALQNEDVLTANPVYLSAALDDFLMQIVGSYYRKQFAVGNAMAGRLQPTSSQRIGSYQWHHDTRGRQIHMMILLSDVSTEGQRMSYLRRSHNQYYDRFRGSGDGSRFEKDIDNNDPKIRERIVELTGPAGTVGLFDSNGLHSGNRNSREKRDALLFCFVSHQRHFKPVSVRRTDLASLPEAKRGLLEFNPRLNLVD